MDQKTPVLIVDDDRATRVILQSLLSQHGYECTLAEDAAVARQMIAQREFDLVISDINMPGESGLDLVFDLLRRWPDTAVVMITCNDDPEVAMLALEHGVYGYIIKPLRLNDVLIRLKNALRRRTLEVENRLHLKKLTMGLEIAGQIQRGLYPRGDLTLPGVRIAGRNLSCEAIGGDYYDFLEITEGKIVLAIGDVSGHGAGSALLMAGTRAYLRAQLLEGRSPAEILCRVNDLLVRDVDVGRFVTLFLGIYDTAQGTLSYANAGHEHPFVLRAQSSQREMLASTGMPLGVMPGEVYDDADTIQLGVGDLLILGTDGMWESRNSTRERFERERFWESVFRHRDLDPTELLGCVFETLLDHVGSVQPEDDLTMMVLKRTDD